MVTILFVYWSLHIGACVYTGLVVNDGDATLYHIMTRILEKYHLDDMVHALRVSCRPGTLQFQIEEDTVMVSGARTGKFVLRAIRKNSTHWIISHPEALFS